MKLWLIEQTDNGGYDTYDSAVVAAIDRTSARQTHPDGDWQWMAGKWHWRDSNGDLHPEEAYSQWGYSAWAAPEHVTAQYLGETDREAGVICASFNAG